MSFLRKLFGLEVTGSGNPASAASTVAHEGYSITPDPIAEGGQFRLAARVSREINGEQKEHRLVRADMFSSREEAGEAAIRKAKQLIKEQGDNLFG